MTVDAVTPPQPLLSREREHALTSRQREILDQLSDLFDEGFADLTMAEIAARVSCSLRTLYELAPSRDELVLIVVDRYLSRIGCTAREAIQADMAPLDAVRAYLRAATMAVSRTTEAFARDLATVPAAQALRDAHLEHLVAVTCGLLDLAVERGDIAAVDTAAVARVMVGLGRELSRPEVVPTLRSSPMEAIDTMVEIVLRGLQALASAER